MVTEILTSNDFGNAIKKNRYTIIKFYGPNCKPCKQFAPAFEDLSSRYNKVSFFKVNSMKEELDAFVSACMISTLPTFCFFKDGNYIFQYIYVYSSSIDENYNQIEMMLLKIME